jgi:hypothetical protein
MFSAYMHFTYIFVSGPIYAQEISGSRFVELCLGMVVSETYCYFTHTHTHTHPIPSQNITNKFFFFLHHSQFPHDILASSLSRTETDQPLLSAVPVYRLGPSFPVIF